MRLRQRVFPVIAVLACALLAPVFAPVARAQTANVDQFLQAAALQPGDVPVGMEIRQQAPLAPAALPQLVGMGGGSAASFSGVLGGYTQTLVATNLASALFGAPVVAGDLILAFDTPDDAHAAYATIAQELAMLLPRLPGSSQGGITIQQSAALPAPAIGDEAQEVELTGTAAMGGQNISVVIDLVAVRRGQVEFVTFAAGLQEQSNTAEALAAAIDSNVQANLGLLTGG